MDSCVQRTPDAVTFGEGTLLLDILLINGGQDQKADGDFWGFLVVVREVSKLNTPPAITPETPSITTSCQCQYVSGPMSSNASILSNRLLEFEKSEGWNRRSRKSLAMSNI